MTWELEEAQLQSLEAVLERLESAGIRLKREKCSFMIPKVEYFGHTISEKGMQPMSERVRPTRDAPRPQDVSKLRSFLVILNYSVDTSPTSLPLAPVCQDMELG